MDPIKKGFTPVQIAVERNSLKALRVLLDNGASPNEADPQGVTPSLVAKAKVRNEAMKMLLEAGAFASNAIPERVHTSASVL